MRRFIIIITWVMIVGLGVGIFLAAIGRLWATADQNACRNNLRSIGLALHNYHDFREAFPAAAIKNPDLPPERRLSWLFEIAPYVESLMDARWNKHQHEPWDSEENLQLGQGRWRYHLCPRASETAQPHGLGSTSYIALVGIGSEAATLPKSDPRIGLFGYDRQTTINDVTDGLANTIMVMETDVNLGPWLAGGASTARGLDRTSRPYLGAGRLFGGLHRRGALTVFGDGTVRLVRNSAHDEVLEALVTIAGGDAHDSPWDD